MEGWGFIVADGIGGCGGGWEGGDEVKCLGFRVWGFEGLGLGDLKGL